MRNEIIGVRVRFQDGRSTRRPYIGSPLTRTLSRQGRGFPKRAHTQAPGGQGSSPQPRLTADARRGLAIAHRCCGAGRGSGTFSRKKMWLAPRRKTVPLPPPHPGPSRTSGRTESGSCRTFPLLQKLYSFASYSTILRFMVALPPGAGSTRNRKWFERVAGLRRIPLATASVHPNHRRGNERPRRTASRPPPPSQTG